VVTILNIKDEKLADPRRQDGTGTADIGSENQQINTDDRKDMVNPCE